MWLPVPGLLPGDLKAVVWECVLSRSDHESGQRFPLQGSGGSLRLYGWCRKQTYDERNDGFSRLVRHEQIGKSERRLPGGGLRSDVSGVRPMADEVVNKGTPIIGGPQYRNVGAKICEDFVRSVSDGQIPSSYWVSA